ncbi:hypothetical protein [Schinkia azotoformans]|uniref:hypothetical protein n=2 Tax=Schinkia azotoformans TaxID=1454 RepID=UPI003D289B5A
MRKTLSLMMVLVLLLSLIVPSVFAEDTPAPPDATKSITTTVDDTGTGNTNAIDSALTNEDKNQTVDKQSTKEPSNKTTIEDKSDKSLEGVEKVDDSLSNLPTEVEKENDGFHVNVYYNANLRIPEFTLELWSLEDKLLSSVKANASNYNNDRDRYELVLNYNGYKEGDQLAVFVRRQVSS